MKNQTLRLSPSLLNSFRYYIEDAPFLDKERLINEINGVKEPANAAMQAGIDFENAVRAMVNPQGVVITRIDTQNGMGSGFTDDGNPVYIPKVFDWFVKETAGGAWQVVVNHEIQSGKYLVRLNGFIDVLKEDKVIDVKTTGQYEFPKYSKGFQHTVYMLGSGLQKMDYLVTDFRDYYRESYTLTDEMMNDLNNHVAGLIHFLETNSSEINWKYRLSN